jgi:hypothetical protein
MTFSLPCGSGAIDPVQSDAGAPHWSWPLAFAERACCCAAKPGLLAVMPPTTVRNYPVDLLLCHHHFKASRVALRAAGAIVYDENGTLIKTVLHLPPAVRVARRADPAPHGRIPPDA